MLGEFVADLDDIGVPADLEVLLRRAGRKQVLQQCDSAGLGNGGKAKKVYQRPGALTREQSASRKWLRPGSRLCEHRQMARAAQASAAIRAIERKDWWTAINALRPPGQPLPRACVSPARAVRPIGPLR
jgi:hypothetical protein